MTPAARRCRLGKAKPTCWRHASPLDKSIPHTSFHHRVAEQLGDTGCARAAGPAKSTRQRRLGGGRGKLKWRGNTRGDPASRSAATHRRGRAINGNTLVRWRSAETSGPRKQFAPMRSRPSRRRVLEFGQAAERDAAPVRRGLDRDSRKDRQVGPKSVTRSSPRPSAAPQSGAIPRWKDTSSASRDCDRHAFCDPRRGNVRHGAQGRCRLRAGSMRRLMAIAKALEAARRSARDGRGQVFEALKRAPAYSSWPHLWAILGL